MNSIDGVDAVVVISTTAIAVPLVAPEDTNKVLLSTTANPFLVLAYGVEVNEINLFNVAVNGRI